MSEYWITTYGYGFSPTQLIDVSHSFEEAKRAANDHAGSAVPFMMMAVKNKWSDGSANYVIECVSLAGLIDYLRTAPRLEAASRQQSSQRRRLPLIDDYDKEMCDMSEPIIDNACTITMKRIEKGALIPDDIEDYCLYLSDGDNPRFLHFDGDDSICAWDDDSHEYIEPPIAGCSFIAIQIDCDGASLLSYEVEAMTWFEVFEGFEQHMAELWRQHQETPAKVTQTSQLEGGYLEGHYSVFAGFID